MKLCLLAAGFVLLPVSGCTGVPRGPEPVRCFELQQCLGQWHEIARPDHGFERGLREVSAKTAAAKS